jgi:cytochrome c oxidase assembly protein subunit 11
MTANKRTVVWLAVLVLTMVSLSFASVPLYGWFCRVTGYAGTPTTAVQGSDTILERTITIRFDGSVTSEMPWIFRPAQTTMELRIGETGLAFYEAYNPTDKAIAGTAAFNVLPFAAGEYFTKIDCFCFEIQVLQPGERVMMPVTFYVDPAIVDEPEAPNLKEITLSYTFSVTDMPEDQVSLADGLANEDNTTTN